MATLATLHLPSALRAPARVSRSSGRYVPARSHHPPRADLIDSSNLARFDRAATRSRARARSPASPARCTTEQRARDVRVRAPEVLTRTFPPRPTLAAPPPFDATPRLRASRATAASSCACLRRSSTPRRRRPARTWCVPGCVTHTSPYYLPTHLSARTGEPPNDPGSRTLLPLLGLCSRRRRDRSRGASLTIPRRAR